MEWWNDGFFKLDQMVSGYPLSFTHYSIIPAFQNYGPDILAEKNTR
jgi:hypothetical protein